MKTSSKKRNALTLKILTYAVRDCGFNIYNCAICYSYFNFLLVVQKMLYGDLSHGQKNGV